MRPAFLLFLTLMSFLGYSQNEALNISLLNSKLDEQAPVLSPDGQLLAFTISDHPQNIGGTRDLGDIWFSKKTEAGWSAPFHGGKLINNNLHNTVAGFSPDGTQLYIMGHYAEAGKPVTSQGLSVSKKNGDTWSAPVNITIPHFKNKTPYNSGSLSPDATILVFSGEGYETVGAEDIYITFKRDGKWTEPITLGPSINTKSQDVSPSLSPDGMTVFFASNGHSGGGSFDIFAARRKDDTWQSWSKPVNLGSEVNTPGRELFYRKVNNGAFFTSTQNSDGQGDIRFIASKDSVTIPIMINPTEEVKVAAVDTITKIDEVKYAENESPASTKIWGKVLNAKTNEPLPNAAIHFTATNSGATTSAKDGTFSIVLSGLEEYAVKVEAHGYIGEFERLDLKTKVLRDLEMNFRLLPVEIGTTINLKSVLFERSKTVLIASSYDELDMVADFMKENPKVEILLSGHTDNQGRHDLNMKLSRERVVVVKNYLVSKGIDEKRITSKGLGGTKPIADNDAEDTRALNRRVEFTIVKD